jgi:FkbM family methyltransferase
MINLFRIVRFRSYLLVCLIWIMAQFEIFMGSFRTIPIHFRAINTQPDGPLRIRWSSSDAKIFFEIFVDRQYTMRAPAEPTVVLDLGADYGAAGYYFAIMFPEAKIISVEPSPANLNLLASNAKAFPDRWAVDSRAVLSSERMSQFYWSSCHSSGSCSTAVANGRTSNPNRPEAKTARPLCEVRGVDVETLLNQYHVDRISICKMDIEGAEEEVLHPSADTAWLSRTEILMIEIHDKYFDSTPLRSLLHNHGFTLLEKRGWQARTELYQNNR